MAVEVIMPKFDMDQETGTVMEWTKAEGDPVNKGETILVIETDKVAVEVEAPGSGRLEGIRVGVGEEVPIGTVIAFILAEGEPLPEVEPLTDGEPAGSAGGQVGRTQTALATPLARKMAAAHNLDLGRLASAKAGARITKEDVQRLLAEGDKLAATGRVRAVPAARRLARQHGLDLASVSGTGPRGRIQSPDVQAALSLPSGSEGAAVGDAKRIPIVGARKTIADRMTASYQSVPHIRFTARVDMTRFNQTRQRLNEPLADKPDEKISATALMVKLTAMVLEQHPALNSSWAETEILLHRQINIGVAVARDEGLIVPVIKEANKKALQAIAVEVNDLARRGRQGELTLAEVKGGTFTISNLGPYGIEQFDAIINPPEAAILAVGASQMEALPADDGSLQARPVLRLTLSADHRLVDGALAARFLGELKASFEQPPEAIG